MMGRLRLEAGRRLKRFTCQKCPYATGKRGHFRRHIGLHGSGQRFSCDFCDYSVSSCNHLTQHRKSHLSPNLHLLALQSPANLDLLHQLVETQQAAGHVTRGCMPWDQCRHDARQRCPDVGRACCLSYPLPPPLATSPPPSPPPRPFFCDRCPFSSEDRSALLAHLRHHQGGGHCACPFCDFRASGADLVCAHLGVHFFPPTPPSTWQQTRDPRHWRPVLEDVLHALTAARLQGTAEVDQGQGRVSCAEASLCRSLPPTAEAGGQDTLPPSRRGGSGRKTEEGRPDVRPPIPCDQGRCRYCDIPLADSRQLARHQELHMRGNRFLNKEVPRFDLDT